MSKNSTGAAHQKIDALIALGAGEIVANTLNKLISYRLEKYRGCIAQIEAELKKFEKNYKMASDVFYREFEAGNLGDAGDYFEWSSLYENILLYRERIEKMEALITNH